MTATKIQPGDDLHLTSLMAPHSLNFVTGADRAALLAYGRDVFAAGLAGAAPAAVAGPAREEIAALRAEHGITSSGRGIKEFEQVDAFVRAVLQRWGAAPALEAPADQCCNSWFASLPEGRQAVLRDDKWMLASAAYEAGRESCSALEAPAAPATSAQVQALHRARRALHAIGKTYDDSELRMRALEADEEIDRLLAAAPQAPSASLEAVQWRNIHKVVKALADFSFGGPNDPQWGVAHICMTQGLTAKDGLDILSLDLEPLASAQAAPAAPAVDARDAEDAARYRWLFGARTKEQAQTVSGTVHNPLPQDHLLHELQCFFVHKGQVDEAIDAAIAAQAQEGGIAISTVRENSAWPWPSHRNLAQAKEGGA